MTNITLNKQNSIGNTQGWLQVDKATHQKMWMFGIKHPTALAVLHFLVSRMNRGSNGVIISYDAISDKMSISKRTAQNSIAELSKTNFIQVLKSGRSNVYIINSRVAWQGNRGNRHVSFNAEILIVESEQSKPVDQLIEESNNLMTIPVWDDDERILVGNEELPPPDQQEMELL